VTPARLIVALLATVALLGAATPAPSPSATPPPVIGPMVTVTAEPGPPTEHWLLVSDVHFNPFADPALVDALASAPVSGWEALFRSSTQRAPSGYGTDTNDVTLDSALTAMRLADPVPDVVVIDGDFLAHGFQSLFQKDARVHGDAQYRAFVDKTIAYLALRFGETFPSAQFVPSIGNNDSYCGDYESTPGSPFLAHFAAAWGGLVNRHGAADTFDPGVANGFVSGVSAAGHYVTGVPGTSMRLVVPNSVVWSSHYTNRCGNPKTDPTRAELNWLAAALHPATGAPPTIVITHIPPGIDVYSSLQGKTPVLTYADAPNTEVPALLDAPAAGVSLMLTGHFHTDGFRIVGFGGPHPVPLLTVPSISPIFGNAPAFVDARVFPRTATIVDATTYAMGGLPALSSGAPTTIAWNAEYSYHLAFHLPGLDANGLHALQDELVSDPTIRADFEKWFVSGSPVEQMTDVNWPAYWCADVDLTVASWESCLAQQPGTAHQ
jgi:hypothetical protein